MEKNHSQSRLEEVKNLFESQQSLMNEIYKDGFQAYVNKLKNLDQSFIDHDHAVRCIDEGTPDGFHSAGSGILRDKKEVLEAFRKAGVQKITSHDGCGAAKLYAQANKLDVNKSDEYAKEWSKNIAKELGVAYDHISSAEMNRPEGQHISRVVYYDDTGKFDYSKIQELPTGFIISRKIQSSADSIAEAKVSFDIACSDHGFGSLIDSNNQFLIVPIGNSSKAIEELEAELLPLVEELGERVKIDGFYFEK